MQLKSVIINGFKSFADRTEIDFTGGIVAIVGPNGCGKSNIADAIRWVLGEQSAKTLRGIKMDDVIFAGSESRKPVNFAEVSLFLDNSNKRLKVDYSEVVITRRLYRTGESEYLINKQQARLKDIADLFVDTGLGKEAFSIIGQGRIDEILSTKPEDRRGIFEEAAGIVKYKNRKKEAKRKLDDTENNLIRIYDLISEVEGQIEPLREQSARALEYREYYNQLKELNIKIYVHDIGNIYEKWQRSTEQKTTFSADQLELSSELNIIDTAIEKKRWAINKLDQELEGLHQLHLTAIEKVEQEEGKRGILHEREKNQATTKETLLKNTAKITDKYDELKKNVENELLIKQDKVNQIKELEKDLAGKEEYLANFAKNKERELDELKSKYFDLLNNTATLRNDQTHSRNQLNSLQYREEKVKTEISSINENLRIVEDTLNKLDIELTDANQKQIASATDNDQLTNKIEKLTTQKEELTQSITKANNRLNALKSKYDVLREMQASFTGYNQGAKEVLKLRENNRIKGIVGSVAELVTVTPEFEIAIETALGNSLQHIVVNTEEIGREAIQYLKEQKHGRATLLPLDVIKARRMDKAELVKVSKLDGYIGLAVEKVSLEAEYLEIGHFLLGRIILASDLKRANKLAKVLNYNYKIVTLEGDVVNPGGSMTGGDLSKHGSNLLGRQREIDELVKLLSEQESRVTIDQQKSAEMALSITALTTDLEQKLVTYRENEILKQRIQDQIIESGFEKKRLTERVEYLLADKQLLTDETKQLEDKLINIESKLIFNIENEAISLKSIEQATEMLTKEEDAKDELNNIVTEIKVTLATYKEELNNISKSIDRSQIELNDQEKSIKELKKELEELELALNTQQTDLTEISTSLEEYKAERDRLLGIINSKRKERVGISTEIDRAIADSKGLRTQLRNAEDQLHQNEVRLGKLDTQLENLLAQLSEEYEISFEAAREKVEKIENVGQTRSELQRLKVALNQLGEVNLGAIDEFERINERYQFLTTQKADLIAAKESLYQVISEVDQEMTKIFSESFESIREQFRFVFSKLFEGGTADLVLTDPENLLESGVEILAQPPGKKLKSIALLSGGEKALTAIAILFAILHVKPVPFVILDEVDASLDDPNVLKFAQYLHEFGETTQFIIITHRRGTMECVDSLYGVTMQEAGVSKLVSVRFDERDKIEAV